MGGFHAERKRKTGGAYIWPKPALRGRPRPPGLWHPLEHRGWYGGARVGARGRGAASRYRPREKVPKTRI
jgi:hypothetical protein